MSEPLALHADAAAVKPKYLLNVWNVAGWSRDVEAGAVIERTLAELPLAIFRDPAGVVHALDARCPHRFAPLSLGQVTETGLLRCQYHGLAFDGQGRCIDNPHGDGRIPAAAHVRAYPIIERWGMMWIWLGDPRDAASVELPDFAPLDESHSHVARRYLGVKANYVLECDNILDLSHIQFLHPGTLGSSAVQSARTEVTQVGHSVTCSRHVRNEAVSPFLQSAFDIAPGTRVDRWLDVRWDPPCHLLQTVTLAPAGAPRHSGRTLHIAHLFAPESDTSTHYWYASCIARTDGSQDGAARAEFHVSGLTGPFQHEDQPMLEAQQRLIGTRPFWSLQPVLLPTDAAAVRARRLLDGLIAAQ